MDDITAHGSAERSIFNGDNISMNKAAKMAGMSYAKFRRVHWECPYYVTHPGGPRIYSRIEVRTFLQQKTNDANGSNRI